MENQHISVIIPTYQNTERLVQCVESVMLQTYKKYEVIVIDDNGGRLSSFFRRLKKSYPIIRLITNSKNSGAAYSRNQGITHAKYNIIAFIDDDCIADPSWLMAIHQSMKKKNCDAVANFVGPILHPKDRDRSMQFKEGKASQYQKWDFAFHENYLPTTANLAVRKSILRKMRFDESLRWLEDKDLILRILRKHTIVREKNARAYHQEQFSPVSMIRKNFFYGMYEAMLYKRYFRKRCTISYQFAPIKEYSWKTPFTMYIRIKPFEIYCLVTLYFLFFLPLIGALAALCGIMTYVVRYKNIAYSIFMFTKNILATCSNLVGNIIGSIRTASLFL